MITWTYDPARGENVPRCCCGCNLWREWRVAISVWGWECARCGDEQFISALTISRARFANTQAEAAMDVLHGAK